MASTKNVVRPLLLIAALAVTQAHAQSSYPAKPMRWVVPYTAGGGADVIARPIAIRLGEALGQPVVYENRGGANGLIAAEAVAKAPPDGYTFLVAAPNTHIFATLLYDKINYDPVKDFAPITKFDVTPNVLVASASFPAKTIKELIAYGKANPGKILWASSGNGSGGHLGLVLFAEEAGIKVVHVPYKGAGPAITGTLTGDNHLVFVNTGVAIVHIKSGRLRPLGFAGPKRLATLPDVPTFEESGFPGFESTNFQGLMAPAGTRRAIINKLNAELVKIVQMPDTVARMTAAGSIPVGNTPEQFANENRLETAKWAKIIKANGIKAD
jgi:tripartite-type tricarboxylate transporter receptor subunit TctC